MSLKYRIAATIFALETILIAVVLWMTLGQSRQSIREQTAKSEKVIVQLVGDLSRAALLTDEFAELQTFIQQTNRHPRIQAVVVADAAARVVAATDVDLIGHPFPDLSDAEHRYWRVEEVGGRAGRLGTLGIEFSDSSLELAYRDTRNLGITIGVTGMALIALVGLGMGHFLTRRLAGLADAADRVAAGDITVRVALHGHDEVARVGRAFNSMVTRLAHNLDAMTAARDRLIHPTEAMSEGFALWDADDRLVLYNQRFLALFGEGAARVGLGERFEDLARLICTAALAEEGQYVEARVRERLERHRNPRGPLELPLKGGLWVAVSEFRTPDAGTVSIYTDITELKERQRALELGEQRLRAIMNSVIDGILTVTADGTVQSSNPAAARIFGYGLPEAVVGLNVRDLIAAPDRGAGGAPRPLSPADLLALPRHSLLEMVGLRNGGAGFAAELSVAGIDLHGRQTLIVTVRDITARKAAEELVLYHATHDALTALPNRVLFDDRLQTALKHAARAREMVAVLFLDLDHLKIVNDTLGHTIGDALLAAVSGRLRSCVRDEDTVARLGGDEFILVLRGLRSSEDAIKPAHKIREALRPPFHLRGREVHVTVSIGISLYPTDGADGEQLLKCADLALYRAKDGGRDRIQLYDPRLNDQLVEQMLLESQLRRALESEQFTLLYQPQIDLATERVVGVEALVRWQHPTLGLVAPDRFVPVAEEIGLIHPLGIWIMRSACLQHRQWRTRGLSRLRLAINLSPRQLRHGALVERIRDVLLETEMDARQLELELTESALMQEGDSTASLLEGLSNLGVSLALDNFGTGYSALSYLQRFPIRRVKIDRTLVRGMNGSAADPGVVRAVIGMAHGMGVDVVAEGIETPQQLATLRRYGCDQGQGFLLGAPVAAEEIPKLFRSVRLDLVAAR